MIREITHWEQEAGRRKKTGIKFLTPAGLSCYIPNDI